MPSWTKARLPSVNCLFSSNPAPGGDDTADGTESELANERRAKGSKMEIIAFALDASPQLFERENVY
jgi:hypothetical protein